MATYAPKSQTNGATRAEREEVSFELELVRQRKDRLSQRLRFLQDELIRLLGRIEFHRVVGEVEKSNEPRADVIAAAPKLPEEALEASQLIAAIDNEIVRIDALLADLGRREREIRARGFPEVGEPFRSAEFTLYARSTGAKGRAEQVEYLFSEDAPEGAVPVPLPQGYEVEVDARTGARHLELRQRIETPDGEA